MILQCFRESGNPHVHIQHISLEPDATFFISGDRGTDIHDLAAHFEGEPIVYKHEPNAFLNTNLLELLKSWETERVVITGMMTHMCVDATARAASDLGFQVMIAEDACATRDLQYGDTTISGGIGSQGFPCRPQILWQGAEIGRDSCASCSGDGEMTLRAERMWM